MVKVRIDLLRDDGLAAAPEEPAPARAADEVEAPEALKKRGDAAFRRGETAAAARLWTRAAAVARDDRRLAVACLANTARAQLDLGRAADALRAAAEALSLDPDHARARLPGAGPPGAGPSRRRGRGDRVARGERARQPARAGTQGRGGAGPRGRAGRGRRASRRRRRGACADDGDAPRRPTRRRIPRLAARAAAGPAFATTWTAMAAREAASASAREEPGGGRPTRRPPPASTSTCRRRRRRPPGRTPRRPRSRAPAGRAAAGPGDLDGRRAPVRARDPRGKAQGAARGAGRARPGERGARRAWTAMAAVEAADVATAKTRRPVGAPPKRDRKDRGPSGVEPMNAGPQVAEAWTSLETDESAKQAIAACRNDAGAAEGDATARRKAKQVLQEARARKKRAGSCGRPWPTRRPPGLRG